MAIKKFSPSEGQSALISDLLQLGGGIVSGIGQGKSSDKDRKAELERQLQQNIFNIQSQGANAQQELMQSQSSDRLSRDKAGVEASQMDPLAQQKSRAGFSLQGDKVRGWNPTGFDFDADSGMGSFKGGYNDLRPSQNTINMYSPEAAANAEMQDFRMPLANMNPNLPIPDLTQVGLPNTKASNTAELFRKGVFDQQEATRRDEKDAIARAFQNIQDSQQNQLTSSQQVPAQEEKKGSPWWKKLAKIGLIAGGGIATAMTGGAASPLLAAAIGAGTGAASGALDGGLKGALTGGALGGITGGFGGGAAGAAKQGLGAAAKGALTSPKTLLQMAGAGVGGRGGAAMQLASGLVPQGGSQPTMPAWSESPRLDLAAKPLGQFPPQGPPPQSLFGPPQQTAQFNPYAPPQKPKVRF